MPHRTGLMLILAVAPLAVPISGASGQAPLTLEVRSGAYIPVAVGREGPERGGRLGAGLSFGVLFALERTARRHLYLGFSQHRIDCRRDGCGGDGDYVSTAWDLGLRFDLASSDPVPWLRFGLTVPRVERSRPPPLAPDVSELGVGAEAGVGARVQVAGRFSLSPGLRFGAVDAGLPGGGVLRMRYIAADVGVVVGF